MAKSEKCRLEQKARSTLIVIVFVDPYRISRLLTQVSLAEHRYAGDNRTFQHYSFQQLQGPFVLVRLWHRHATGSIRNQYAEQAVTAGAQHARAAEVRSAWPPKDGDVPGACVDREFMKNTSAGSPRRRVSKLDLRDGRKNPLNSEYNTQKS